MKKGFIEVEQQRMSRNCILFRVLCLRLTSQSDNLVLLSITLSPTLDRKLSSTRNALSVISGNYQSTINFAWLVYIHRAFYSVLIELTLFPALVLISLLVTRYACVSVMRNEQNFSKKIAWYMILLLAHFLQQLSTITFRLIDVFAPQRLLVTESVNCVCSLKRLWVMQFQFTLLPSYSIKIIIKFICLIKTK